MLIRENMAKLTKSQLFQVLAEKWGVSKKEAQAMFEALVDLIYEQIKENGEISLPGLGKMKKKERAARMGRNPATGETIQIPAKTVLKFVIAKAAKDQLM